MVDKKIAPKISQENINDASIPEECFVIMPISDQIGYETGHFAKVYEDIFKPACAEAGYKATRADDVKESNLIHLDILKRVVHSPMAICDLSSRNPNVLFELGLRQAFDKPTILVKDLDTLEIFDIAPIRYTQYRQTLRYREVLEDQKAITAAICSTRDATGKPHNVNSLIRLLELSAPAKIAEDGPPNPQEYFQVLLAEITQLKREIRNDRSSIKNNSETENNYQKEIKGRAAVLQSRIRNIRDALSSGRTLESLEEKIIESINFAEDALKYYTNHPELRSSARTESVEKDLEILRNLLSQCL